MGQDKNNENGKKKEKMTSQFSSQNKNKIYDQVECFPPNDTDLGITSLSTICRVHAVHCWFCFISMNVLIPILDDKSLILAFQDIEMAMLEVIFDMEIWGIGFSRSIIFHYRSEVEEKMRYIST
eukprot:UN12373